jgi:hypothetical protein
VGQGEALRPLVSTAMLCFALYISSACSGIDCRFVSRYYLQLLKGLCSPQH